ncbi:hypothetical protein AKG39_15625 [Acetobacterium bakii]|uniref:Uncharacterized protein n=2 Tax=Acetobacterium bakii TaxID=52689 RepID=A0A0L6TWU4_9FIRM|nr:DUF5320 domain-containing protein [Acetobacterium bakii]KNZ40741.1 hypothetical protein AKG39_15625 [Acetobacterium bakii]
MPERDRTGPAGRGSGSGKGLGRCSGINAKGFGKGCGCGRSAKKVTASVQGSEIHDESMTEEIKENKEPETNNQTFKSRD